MTGKTSFWAVVLKRLSVLVGWSGWLGSNFYSNDADCDTVVLWRS